MRQAVKEVLKWYAYIVTCFFIFALLYGLIPKSFVFDIVNIFYEMDNDAYSVEWLVIYQFIIAALALILNGVLIYLLSRRQAAEAHKNVSVKCPKCGSADTGSTGPWGKPSTGICYSCERLFKM